MTVGVFMDGVNLCGSGEDLFLNKEGHTDPTLRGTARADSVFIAARGPSATRERMEALAGLNIPTMGINGLPDGCRPDYWCTADTPGHFPYFDLWEDPGLIKLMSIFWHCHSPHAVMDHADAIELFHCKLRRAASYPNVRYYCFAYDVSPYNFFTAPWAYIGISPDDTRQCPGARSVMFPAMRCCHDIGYKTVYLIGCDLDPKYHPDPHYVPILLSIMKFIRPIFDENGFRVVNCNPEGSLKDVFETMSFDEALSEHRSANLALEGVLT